MKRFSLFFFVWLMTISVAQAATLEDLQDAAVENRDIVKRYQAVVDQRIEGVREARGNLFPSVDAAYTLNRLDNDNLPYEYKRNDAGRIGLAWNVFAGFGDKYNIKSAEVSRESERFRLEAVKQDIRLNVAVRFLAVHRNKAYLKVTEDALDLYRDRYRETELKCKVGILKRSDVLKIKVEMDNALQEARRARAQLAASVNNLQRETDRGVALESLDFSCFQALPGKGVYAEYEGLLLQRRSEIKALEMVSEAAAYKTRASRAAFLPRVDVGLSYSTSAGDDYFFGDPDYDGEEWRCQAKASINLFDGMKKDARLSQARLEEKKAGYDLRELKETLKVRLKNTLLDLDVAFDNLAVAGSSEAEAEENLRVTDLTFKQGLATSTDILDAIYYLARARFNVIDAHRLVFSSYFQLQRLIEGFSLRTGS